MMVVSLPEALLWSCNRYVITLSLREALLWCKTFEHLCTTIDENDMRNEKTSWFGSTWKNNFFVALKIFKNFRPR